MSAPTSAPMPNERTLAELRAMLVTVQTNMAAESYFLSRCRDAEERSAIADTICRLKRDQRALVAAIREYTDAITLDEAELQTLADLWHDAVSVSDFFPSERARLWEDMQRDALRAKRREATDAECDAAFDRDIPTTPSTIDGTATAAALDACLTGLTDDTTRAEAA